MTMYTTESCPCDQAFTEECEYDPADAYVSPEEAAAELDQALAEMEVWGAVNTVCDALVALGLQDLAIRVRLAMDEDEDDIPF